MYLSLLYQNGNNMIRRGVTPLSYIVVLLVVVSTQNKNKNMQVHLIPPILILPWALLMFCAVFNLLYLHFIGGIGCEEWMVLVDAEGGIIKSGNRYLATCTEGTNIGRYTKSYPYIYLYVCTHLIYPHRFTYLCHLLASLAAILSHSTTTTATLLLFSIYYNPTMTHDMSRHIVGYKTAPMFA